jgi:putative ABC transport system permease protein
MVAVARRNLFAEKGKFAISVAGVSFSVLLILVVLSLYRGWSGIGGVIEELPADLWVMQQGTTDPFHSVSLLDEGVASQIEGLDGVETVAPTYARTMSVEVKGESTPLFLIALDPAGIPAGSSPYLPVPGTIAVDRSFSNKHGVGVGDSVEVDDRELHVAGTFAGGNAVMFQIAFIAPDDARAIFGFPGAANYFLVTLDDGADPAAVEEELQSTLGGVNVLTGQEFTDGLRREINEGFLPVVGVLVLIGFVVGVAVIGLTAYTATIEKARDFGVMKAVGASGGYLYRVVMSQSLIVGVIGFGVGLAGALAVSLFAEELVPEFVTELRWYDALGVFGASLVMALAASYLPITRINRIDPASVFRA